jgi:dienelactone hydrolase
VTPSAAAPVAATVPILPAASFPFVPSASVHVDLDPPIPLSPGVRAIDVRIHAGNDVIGGRFVEPEGGASHPGVLFVHWLGDPKTTNMTEFVPEAQALARRGVASLMIDAFWAKPNWFETGRSPATDYADSLRQVAQLRAAIDALAAHPNIDGARLAFVGHDFGAMYGAVLSGLDARIRFFVFIAGNPDFATWYLLGKKPADVAAYKRQMAPLDPLSYLRVSHGADYLYQFGLKDQYIPIDRAHRFFDASPSPKALMFYAGGHALRSPLAVSDRIEWLLSRFGASGSAR